MMNIALILTTVNAPYSEQLDAATLVQCLKDAALAKSKPGHMSSFFGEVDPESQKAFAAHFGIDEQILAVAAHEFAAYSGEDYPLAV
jgi:hypothetical protein